LSAEPDYGIGQEVGGFQAFLHAGMASRLV